jgi:hypothetical protein
MVAVSHNSRRTFAETVRGSRSAAMFSRHMCATRAEGTSL